MIERANNTFKFIRRFFYKPLSVGAILPSSQGLSKLITDSSLLSKADVVVELGPGTGVFTEKILQRVKKSASVFAFEIDPLLANITQKRCRNAVVINDSALNLRKHLHRYNIKNADVIISSLPCAGFNKMFQYRLLNTVTDALSDGGEFLTFTYLHTKLLPGGRSFKKIINRKFQSLKISKPVWANLPPAIVYDCRKPSNNKMLKENLL